MKTATNSTGHSPNLQWNRPADMPALHPMQCWGCCCPTAGQGKTLPLSQVTEEQAPLVYSNLQHIWKKLPRNGAWIQYYCWVSAPHPSSCLSIHSPASCPPISPSINPSLLSSPPSLALPKWLCSASNLTLFLCLCRYIETGTHLCTSLTYPTPPTLMQEGLMALL